MARYQKATRKDHSQGFQEHFNSFSTRTTSPFEQKAWPSMPNGILLCASVSTHSPQARVSNSCSVSLSGDRGSIFGMMLSYWEGCMPNKQRKREKDRQTGNGVHQQRRKVVRTWSQRIPVLWHVDDWQYCMIRRTHLFRHWRTGMAIRYLQYPSFVEFICSGDPARSSQQLVVVCATSHQVFSSVTNAIFLWTIEGQ